MNLFESVMVFTDIHFGLKNNSSEHNQDCLDFVEWMIAEAKKKNCKTCIFMGDWSHHRSNINLLTLDYTMQALKKLDSYFDKTYILVGNHDLFYRESRSVHSMVITTEFNNIVLIDKPLVINNVAFVPWLVEDEWKNVCNMNSKYLFGHLELPGFKMNAQIAMPDTGELNSGHFSHQDYVFSGHFHIRQTKGKVNYIGNPFGHNYSDVWDFDRGAMYLDWDKEPEYINYTGGPRFISINLAALLTNPDIYLIPKTYLQVTLDVDITYEEASFLRETFLSQYNVREFKLIRNQADDLTKEFNNDISLKTVDQIVIECLAALETDSKFDIAKFIEIYNGL